MRIRQGWCGTAAGVLFVLTAVIPSAHTVFGLGIKAIPETQRPVIASSLLLASPSTSLSSTLSSSNPPSFQPSTSLSVSSSSSRRRRLLQGAGRLSPLIGTAGALVVVAPKSASAALFANNRRQLEVCIVQVIRVVYWAVTMALDLQHAETAEKRKQRYLEARLAAKAILTGKIGSGATGRVYTLATLQLAGCLQDLESYATRSNLRRVQDLRQDFYEAVAAVVEFDGLETLQDASPRSTLTLQQYNNDKAVYVLRLLRERVVPGGEQLVDAFGPDTRDVCRAYIAQNYGSEVPPVRPVEPPLVVEGA